MILCSFRNLHLSFSSKVLFEGAELVINEGDRIGLLGLNGTGKSSLFKVLEGEQGADTSAPPFTFDKNDAFSLFHIPQEIPATIAKETTINELIWHFYSDEKKQFDRLNELNKLIEESSSPEEKWFEEQGHILSELEDRNFWQKGDLYRSYCKSLGLQDFQTTLGELSGGQQKKCLLALGLSTDRKLVLWDEPTNHLDVETIRKFENELLTSGQTFILVTHDRYLLGKTTNKIFKISQKKIDTFSGSYTDFLELEAEKEKARQQLLSRLKNSFRREDAWMKQGIKARGTRSKKRVENFQDIKSQITKLKEGAKRDLLLNIEDTKKKSKLLLEAKSLSFSYPNSAPLFEDLSFDLYQGNKIGLIGPNGVGKTTFINLIQEKVHPDKGSFYRAPELKIKVFSQQREELPLDKSPFEVLGEGSDQVSLPHGETQHVMSYFKKFLFDGDQIHRPLRTFSGGERNRLQLALNLKESADIWVFDEPTNDLDLETLLILEKTLQAFKGSIILISHDRAFLKNCTNRLFVMSRSEPMEIFEGGYEQAESYLEAKALEEEIEKEASNSFTQKTPGPISESETAKPKKPKMTAAEIQKEIDELESLIEKIDKLLEELGRVQSSEDSIDKLTQLSLKKEEKEEELLQLYEWLEDL